MLSVLVPVYNWDVGELVKKIHAQLLTLAIDFEILIVDDFSSNQFSNSVLNDLLCCRYQVLNKNIGRSAIRNFLVKKAKFDWLLFLDCDVLPVEDNFIFKYVDILKKSSQHVFIGGISYQKDDKVKSLRWKYGKKVEEVSLSIRKKYPNKYFFTANFLIHKKIFNQILFDETINQYGYEDLIFSNHLFDANVKVSHIHNPVFHLGIDSNLDFVIKTEKALENFLVLKKQNKLNSSDIPNIYKFYKKSSFLKLDFLFVHLSDFFKKRCINKSSLLFFNLYRISYLHQIIKEIN